MNIVVIGLGSIGKKHVDALYAIHVTATIYALRSRNIDEKYSTI
jgi:cell division GTPase FtsZ